MIKNNNIVFRNKNDYTDELNKNFNLISITKNYKIIGSSVNKLIEYHSDYDLNEYIESKKYEKIYNRFKIIFKKAKLDKNVFITDFKCGEINNEPIRWSYDDIIKGYKDNVSFIEALKNPKVCKLDIIVLIDNKLTEITNNYFFIKDEEPIHVKMESLKNDYEKLINEGNYMKALKRLYSINKITNKANKLNKVILQILNSDLGLLSKCRSDLDIVLLYIDNKWRPYDVNVVLHNLQLIKYELSGVIMENNFSSKIDNIKNNDNLINSIKNIRDIIYNYINNEIFKEFFKK